MKFELKAQHICRVKSILSLTEKETRDIRKIKKKKRYDENTRKGINNIKI